MYQPFDGPRRVARSRQAHLIRTYASRVTKVEGELGTCAVGTKVTMAYDVPPQAWYFSATAPAP